MKILLDQFEQQIDETILERGLSYFKKGHVLDMEETGRGQYEFTVEGSDIYTVQLKIKGNTVSHCSCDCPHDTLICKHIVACLFYLQKDLFADITTTSSKKEKKNRPAKPKKMSEAEQVKAILKVLSHEELKEVFYSACKKDSKLKLSFIATHLHLLEEESKDLYIKQLKILIKGYTGKYGFIEYRDSKQLCSKINEFIKKANTYCEQNQYSRGCYGVKQSRNKSKKTHVILLIHRYFFDLISFISLTVKNLFLVHFCCTFVTRNKIIFITLTSEKPKGGIK